MADNIVDDFDISDPSVLFAQWFEQAKAHTAIAEPTAMSLATAGENGAPSNRIVLLKEQDENRFTFYTNYQGRKSKEISENHRAALCFYWMPLDKQVRLEGTISRATPEQSDAYFASRPRRSQLGAWASLQSQPMERFEMLDERMEEFDAKFHNQTVPRPPHWGGWTLTANRAEFWHQEPNRLHRRWVYEWVDGKWQKGWLFP